MPDARCAVLLAGRLELAEDVGSQRNGPRWPLGRGWAGGNSGAGMGRGGLESLD